MQMKYVVQLADAERETLQAVFKQKRVSAQRSRRAQVLLKRKAGIPENSRFSAVVAEGFEPPTSWV